jgi:hypothetical protein
MKYSAIDLHSNNNVLVVTDETDRVLVEKRLPNELNRTIGDRPRLFDAENIRGLSPIIRSGNRLETIR